MRRISAELVVYMPYGMEIAFEKIHSISNTTVSVADDPGSIKEGYSPEFLEFHSGNDCSQILLVYRGAV
jgi:hypothetical protein